MPVRAESRWLVRAVAGAAALLGLLVVLSPPRPPARPSPRLSAQASRHDVRILRDTWGVPHVFGKTDADTAYGLAWAHAEDDFPTIQGALLAARGRLASVLGPEGAPNDYLVGLLRVWDVVEAGYGRDLSPEARAICEAYADGINHYAARHPGAALPGLYPVRGQDVVAGFVHKLPLFFGLDKVLTQIFGPARPRPSSLLAANRRDEEAALGSNTIAVSPRRSADGYTRLAVNSHQPWAGPVAWYEVHLRSEQGWDMVGGVFPGSPVVLHGHNRDLGWAHTVNRPHLIDVYLLETNPQNPNQYRFDGVWRELEVRRVPIEVKLLGPLHWTFEREALWSVHGPVVRRPHGTYAIRFAGLGEVRQVEQWYRMNRARNLEEWHAAMRMGALPMFNCGYADREGNIEYVYNARLPRRRGASEEAGYLRGDTSATLWTEYLPFEELPRVTNPPSGFVVNSNSSPFEATLGPGNPDPARYPGDLGIETHLTNRALRALELFGGDEPITREAFDRYKFDTAYSPRSTTARRFHELLDGRLPEDALVREAADLLRRWDLNTDPGNPAAALALLTLKPKDDDQSPPLERFALLSRLEEAAQTLQRTFGRLDVPWGEVQRLRRGAVDLPLDGGPDTLHAVYARRAGDGRLVGWAGDSYVLQVEWDRGGEVHSRSIHQYGSATLDERSPHYADQAPLFARHELKPVWRDETEIRRHLEREYRPGQEGPESHPRATPERLPVASASSRGSPAPLEIRARRPALARGGERDAALRVGHPEREREE
jgi:acyl-homoserine-lactone acylase